MFVFSYLSELIPQKPEPIKLDDYLQMAYLIDNPDEVLAWLKKHSGSQQLIKCGVFNNGITFLHAAIFAANRRKDQKTDLKLVRDTHLQLIEYLLDNGADIDAQAPSKQFTPLMFAGRFLLTDVFELLLERGADLSLKSAETNPKTKAPDPRTVEEMMPNIHDEIRKPIILNLIAQHSHELGLCSLLQ